MTEVQKKYRRCLVLAGGGGRLGVHLGFHAAACEAGLPPDVLLGTCGGALVAALIHSEPDPARQLALLAGPEMYRFWCAVQPRSPANFAAALAGVARRALDVRLAPRVPDHDRDALFKVNGDWPKPRWRSNSAGPDVVVLGARLLAASNDIGQARSGRALMEAVAIGPSRACALLANAASAVGTGAHAGSAVAPKLATADASAISLSDAVRISVTDMIYLPTAQAAGARWLGGAVDLMPVELAVQLAEDVWIDLKDAVPRWTMEPAWRAVLGFNAKRRQHEIDHTPVALRFDNRALERDVPRSVLTRELVFSRGRPQLRLRPCADEADYRSVIQAQFEEGRRRMRSALANANPEPNPNSNPKERAASSAA
jgi:hypothetical protein